MCNSYMLRSWGVCATAALQICSWRCLLGWLARHEAQAASLLGGSATLALRLITWRCTFD
eukprot:scaffold93886_cov17-Tisochrysis_lutea.AAC.1